ncbi:peptidoglycan-binding domain-containing protein [Ornithinimicrobium tianjinense]|uniref:Peptidoglycan binding-like domain-containing protein n=1 Tax=Ornithinimicrobium tianjinense TaxID=1195761 RepID=A0A917BWV6_9MICO|nr:peptidoglycan-binding domain-containing protein [Ornithinimicrobium tianjinense]GGF58772.1 hypothetical protein GCM10011366_28280 [Ornithinimicrobium tianjinense]
MVNLRTPADVADREVMLRRLGYDVYDGPSTVRAGLCHPPPNGHAHRSDSTHYVDAGGGFGTPRAGGAVDVGKDPAVGVAVSEFEKAHLDDLAVVLKKAGFRVIWGVENHFDHLHFDYNVDGGHMLGPLQGPNGGFTVAQITDVQKRLRQLRRKNGRRYYSGTLDGLRQTHTRKAIRDFKRDHGLPVDDAPDRVMRQTLAAALRRQAAAKDTAAKNKASKDKGAKDKAPSVDTAPKDKEGGEGTAADLRARLARFRIAGPTSFSTSVAAASFVPPQGSGVLLAARGTSDETVGSLAAMRTGATFLLLRDDGGLPAPVRRHLASTGPDWVRVVGGFLAVPDATVALALRAAGIRF